MSTGQSGASCIIMSQNYWCVSFVWQAQQVDCMVWDVLLLTFFRLHLSSALFGLNSLGCIASLE